MMLRLCAFWMLFACAVAMAQVPAPDTPAGKVFAAWLSGFNSADPRRIDAFDKTYHQTRVPLNASLAMRERTGGFLLLQVEKNDPYAFAALLKEVDSENAVRLSLTISEDQPTVLLATDLKLVDLPAALQPARIGEAAALASMDARASQLAMEDKFAGQLLVARDGKILLDKSWGLADREKGKPVTRETQFRLASMNKMFTTVAIFQLIEAGKVTLSDPLIRFLPDYPNQELAAKVTIRHLLTHTGGTGDFFGPGFDQYRLQLRDHAAYIRQFGARPLLAEPGARFQYSNYGFVLLGAVVEKASGLSYYTYVDQKIYQPAGMRHTGSLPEDVDVPGRAKGYMKRAGAWASHADTLPLRGSAAGGGYSTTHDLLLFAQALQAGKLISAASVDAATVPEGSGFGTGLGFMHDGDGPSRMFGHNGGAAGMSGALWIYPRAGYVVIGLSNLDPGSATRPMIFFTRRMPLR